MHASGSRLTVELPPCFDPGREEAEFQGNATMKQAQRLVSRTGRCFLLNHITHLPKPHPRIKNFNFEAKMLISILDRAH